MLRIKAVDPNKLSAGMRQYYDVKIQNMDNVVFFRLGDFYEMFFDDAITVSAELELALTGRDCGLDERAPMCGVPYHACDVYIKKLMEFGHNVVICDQVEDPATAKGIVKREVVRIITPGTVIESSMLDEEKNNWLCSCYLYDKSCAVCFADMSTGEAHLFNVTDKELEVGIINKLSRFSPVEILCQREFLHLNSVCDFVSDKMKASLHALDESKFVVSDNISAIFAQFNCSSIESIGLNEADESTKAVAALFGYIYETQKTNVGRFSQIVQHDGEQVMILGYTARNNLEISKTLRNGDKKGSLLWVLDSTKTSMGRRMLKSYIEQPLINPYRIIRRHDAVEAMCRDTVSLGELCESLSGVYDIERLMTRVMYKTATPNDLKSLSYTALRLPAVKELLSNFNSDLIRDLNSDISVLEDICSLIENAIVDNPPSALKDGDVIKDGFNDELDNLRYVVKNGKKIIEDIAERERERTGIKNLKIGYNRVFGYYIEVTRSFYDLVPNDYIRKQTLANAERFITEELKNAENTILGASEKIIALESAIFNEVRDFVASWLDVIQKTATALANIDVLASFATVSINNNYTKPEMAIDGIIQIKNGRHPVVELMLKDEMFVPNDTYLDLSDNRMSIITGPNMSGKSTYMRQVALITLMAQIGCFVPADYAKISVVDQIFTRVGASDDLSAGQSTFMVEMSEVADIVKHATQRSLVILDEVGRGTSTFDGISIAQSVAEYIADPKHIGCKTLFATHYHELIELEDKLCGVKNYSVAVKRHGDGIRFLRKIVRGGVDESYGIEVAKLAGLPTKILKRAKELLTNLELKNASATHIKSNDDQISFDAINETSAIDILRKTNIDELSDAELRELIEDVIKYI